MAENNKHWSDLIGEYAYVIINNKVIRKRITGGRVTTQLNTGSDRHGRLLDPVFEYKVDGIENWKNEKDIFTTKEEFMNSIN